MKFYYFVTLFSSCFFVNSLCKNGNGTNVYIVTLELLERLSGYVKEHSLLTQSKTSDRGKFCHLLEKPHQDWFIVTNKSKPLPENFRVIDATIDTINEFEVAQLIIQRLAEFCPPKKPDPNWKENKAKSELEIIKGTPFDLDYAKLEELMNKYREDQIGTGKDIAWLLVGITLPMSFLLVFLSLALIWISIEHEEPLIELHQSYCESCRKKQV